MSVFPVFPSDIEFQFPADLGDYRCRLAWRRSAMDGSSRNDFRWPLPGEWTEEVEADRSDLECSWGLHAAKNWAGSSIHAPLFQLIAVPEGIIAHDGANKFRFCRAAVLAHIDILPIIRHGGFAGANLTGANLADADLTDANLTGANLACADLTCADLACADLTGANLTGANLYGANLTDANLEGANLAGADLQYADVKYANFQGADLCGADFREANVLGAIGLPS